MFQDREGHLFPPSASSRDSSSSLEMNLMGLAQLNVRTSQDGSPPPISTLWGGRKSSDSSGYGSGQSTPCPPVHPWETGTPQDFSQGGHPPPLGLSSQNTTLEDGDATPTPGKFGFSTAPPTFPTMGLLAKQAVWEPPAFPQKVQYRPVQFRNPVRGPVTAGGEGRQLNPLAAPYDPSGEKTVTGRVPERKLKEFLDKCLPTLTEEEIKQKTAESVKQAEKIREKDLYAEILEELRQGKTRRAPPPGYVCHICYLQDDHIIQDCPGKHRGEGLTPYQGSKQCYGEFQCGRCHRKWKSCHSWANMSERCNKCGVIPSIPGWKNENYPTRQFPLEHALRLGLIYKDQRDKYHIVTLPKKSHPQTPPTRAPTSTRNPPVSRGGPLVNIGHWEERPPQGSGYPSGVEKARAQNSPAWPGMDHWSDGEAGKGGVAPAGVEAAGFKMDFWTPQGPGKAQGYGNHRWGTGY